MAKKSGKKSVPWSGIPSYIGTNIKKYVKTAFAKGTGETIDSIFESIKSLIFNIFN